MTGTSPTCRKVLRWLVGARSGHAPQPPPRRTNQNRASVSEGARDNFLTSEAGKLQRIGLDTPALSAALTLYETRCHPPLPDPESGSHCARHPAISTLDRGGAKTRHSAPRNGNPPRADFVGGKLQILAVPPWPRKTTIALKFAATITKGWDLARQAARANQQRADLVRGG